MLGDTKTRALIVLSALLFVLGLGVSSAPANQLEIRLPTPPARQYSTADKEATEHEQRFAAALARQWPEFDYSPRLSQAAEALATVSLDVGQNRFPPGFLQYLVNHYGRPEYTSASLALSTNTANPESVLTRLAPQLDAFRAVFNRIGMARVAESDNGGRWRWMIILTRQEFELAHPIDRSQEVDSELHLKFKPDETVSSPKVTWMRDGTVFMRPEIVRDDQGWLSCTIPIGSPTGQRWLQITAATTAGASIIAQFPIMVGSGGEHEQIGVWRGEAIPDESPIQSIEQAEAQMIDMVNQARTNFGLAPLIHDPELTPIARAHSRDMHEHSYFSHTSPTRGDLAQRLSAAGYQITSARENIGNAATVAGAHAALWASPSHRANILATDVTRIGIGIIRTDTDALKNQYLITQIFATPAEAPQQSQVAERVEDEIQQARRRADLDELLWCEPLRRAAQELLPGTVATGRLNQDELRRSFDRIQDTEFSIRRLQAEMMMADTIRGFRASNLPRDPQLDSFGYAVGSSPRDNQSPLFYVIVLYADTRVGQPGQSHSRPLPPDLENADPSSSPSG